MDKDILLLGLFLGVTGGAIGGVVAAWRLPNRAARALTIVVLAAAYLGASFLIVEWASQGGCMSGFLVALVVLPGAPVVALGMVVCAIVAGFTVTSGRDGQGAKGWRAGRLVGMCACLGLLAIVVVGLALNRPLRVQWHQRGLSAPDPAVRRQAVEMLGDIGHESATPALCGALADADAGVRQRAAFALLLVEDPSAVPALRRALEDKSSDVRCTAASAFGVLAGPAGIPDLIGLLVDEDAKVREAAVQSLNGLDPLWRRRRDVPPQYRDADR